MSEIDKAILPKKWELLDLYVMNSEILDHQFLASDQPQTCPSCRLRPEILTDFSHTTSKIQIDQCLDLRCRFQFVNSFED